MELKAIYKNKPDCRSCVDLGCIDVTYCPECMRLCTEEVDVLEVGVGLFGGRAIIKKKSGELKTVLITELIIK